MLSSSVWRGLPPYAFSLGLVLGGVISGLGVMLVGSVLRAVLPVTAVAVATVVVLVVLAAREFGWPAFSLPQNARLVPETVFRHGRFFGPLQFGIEMGTGMRTYVPSGLPYAALVLVAGLAGPLTALAAGAAFGLGRAVMTIGSQYYGVESGDWDLAWISWERWLKATLVLAFAAGQAVLVLPLLT
ncbi:hypothetical protein [Streptomyces sp. NPDC047108]|uniref:hypothetical protein n=1 Tax=Streptomyces sp. NPDC047108 TaxID=3155025 RepID=UPI0033F7FB3E